jgi:MFS family permease
MNIKYNVPLMYAIACLMWSRFFIPVLALFYIASQVPLEQFAIIMSAFGLANFLLEIPTGVVADLIGKKKTLMIGRSLYIVEVAILAFSNGFLPFLTAKIISGMAVSFVSGANEALLFDTLKKQNKVKEHKRVSGIMFALANITMAFVFITGAYLFTINPKLPAIASLPPLIIGLVLTFLLVEPYESRKKANFRNAWIHFKEGMRFAATHKIVRYIILFAMIGYATIDLATSISSAYLEAIQIPIASIGIVAFAYSMLVAGVSRKTHALEHAIGDKKSILLIQILQIASFLLMSLIMPVYGVAFYLLFGIGTGFFFVLMNHYINVHIDTAHRATIISIKHMAAQLCVFLVWPAFGFITKKASLGTAYFYYGIFLLFYSALLYLFSRNIKVGELNEKQHA